MIVARPPARQDSVVQIQKVGKTYIYVAIDFGIDAGENRGVADQMIAHPKTVQELYEKLPDAKREAIEKRDQS